jgi:O-antigen ligase
VTQPAASVAKPLGLGFQAPDPVAPPVQAAGAGAATIALYAMLTFFMFGPLPQLFSGVDTTVTGVSADKSWFLIFKTAASVLWLPRLASSRAGAVAAAPLGATLRRTWPVLLYFAWALVSIAWASLPYVAARCAFELMLAGLYAYTLCTRFTRADAFRIVYLGLSILVTVSAVLALAVPSMGVHQASDVMNKTHAGQWRGVFGHKNLLGQLTGLHFALTVVLAPRLIRSRLALVALAAISALTLVKTGSSTAIVIAATGIGGWAVLQVEGRPRALAVLSVLCLVLILAVSNLDVVGAVAALLGKDPTLTGRTGVWQTVLGQMDGYWLAGHGYANFNVAGEYLTRVYGVGIPDAHSGYLEMLFTLGVVGVGLFAVMTGRAGWAALRHARRPDTEMVVSGAILACWLIAALSEVSPFRPVNGLHLIGLVAVITLLQGAQTRTAGR